MTTPDGTRVPRNVAHARRGGGAGQRRNVTRQKKQKQRPARQRAPLEDPSVAITGVPSGRICVNPPTVTTVSGVISLAAADAVKGGKVFVILLSQLTCDPNQFNRARVHYTARLCSDIKVTYEPSANMLTGGFLTFRPIRYPGAGYTIPVPADAAAMSTHGTLAGQCRESMRCRCDGSHPTLGTGKAITRPVLTIRMGPESRGDVENDVLQGGAKRANESFRQDGQLLFLEITASDVATSIIGDGVSLGKVYVDYRMRFGGDHPEALED